LRVAGYPPETKECSANSAKHFSPMKNKGTPNHQAPLFLLSIFHAFRLFMADVNSALKSRTPHERR
jgi:hypothetical protein